MIRHPFRPRFPFGRRSRVRQAGLLLASATGGGGGGGGGSSSPNADFDQTKPKIALNLTAGPTGVDPYRPWSVAVLDGVFSIANGHDQPKWWDEANTAWRNLGSTAPTTFAVADSGSGTAHTSGTTLLYYLAFRNSVLGKETAPQQTSGVPGTSHTMSATKDAVITWTDPGGEYDQAVIYRALADSNTYHRVAVVTASTATYTDSTSDTTLRTNARYVTRSRGTLPPIFAGLATHLNRLWGFVKGSATLYFAQSARADSEFVNDDFPDANFLQVTPDDGAGDIRAVRPHYSSLYVFKRRSVYEVAGSDPATFEVRRMFAQRGALGHRCVVDVDGNMVVLDDQGLYLWTPGGEPITAGSPPGVRENRILSVWKRMNTTAANTFWLYHDEDERVVKAYIALDWEPVPSHRVVYDYARNRIVSIDTLVCGMAGGTLEDSFGTEHEVRLDDLGYAWEEDLDDSDGVTAGHTSATVTSFSSGVITASGATFSTDYDEGAWGSAFERASSAGTLLDSNRALNVTSTGIEPLYYSPNAVSANDTLKLGVIAAVVESPSLRFDTPEKKIIDSVVLEHDSGFANAFTFRTRTNDSAFSGTGATVTATSSVRSIVPVQNRGWTWSWQLYQSDADGGFSIRAVSPNVSVIEGQRT